jgi:2-phosphosulfolactate phosphatase
MQPQVIIDCFPESARRYTEDCTVVAIDVIRATTSAISAVASGRRCITVPSLDAMRAVASRLENPLLVGELGGDMPEGLHMNNSPVELLERRDAERPVVLLSTSGTRLIYEARHANHTLLACFRNCDATARYLISGKFQRVVLIGAGSRGEFREEDQMCCAWIAASLIHAGWDAANSGTRGFVDLWRGAAADTCRISNSAKYLLRSGQERDLDFVIEHVNDLDSVFFADKDGEIFECEPAAHPSRSLKTLAPTVGEVTIGPR